MAQELPPSTIAASREYAGSSARRTRSRPRAKTGAAVVVHFLLGISLVGLIAAGWFLFVQYGQLERSQQTLANAESRIQALEDRLRLTDETLTESDADTSKQISLWESEIRKLWDLSNKRNKGWIEDNRAAIARHATGIAATEADLQDVKSTVSRLDASASRQQEVVDRLTALEMQTPRLVRQQQDLADKVNAASRLASGLKSTLESRVQDNEDAIKSIDANRARLNADVAELRRRIDSPSSL